MSNTDQILKKCINPNLMWLRTLFQSEGFDIRIVGGAVRDILANAEPKDIDLCTNAYPEEAIDLYKKHNIRYELTGLDHGTISVIMNSEVYEITSLRYDMETDGRHAVVRFTREWEEDLARRDLTINAMSMSFDGELFDPFGGQEDLKTGVVRFVGDDEQRIQEDYLRILRYFRFAGRFASRINDEDQISAIRKNAHGLRQISRERIWQEVSKILVHPSAWHVYEAMASANVLEHSDLPPLSPEALHQLRRFKHAHKCARALPATVFSTLISTDDDAVSYAKKLKMSSAETRIVREIVKFKNENAEALSSASTLFHALERKMVLDGWSQELAIQAALTMQWYDIVLQLQDVYIATFPINGYKLSAHGFKPGKDMGEILRMLKVKWFESNYQLTEANLLSMALTMRV